MLSLQAVSVVLLSLQWWHATTTLQGSPGWRRCERVDECHAYGPLGPRTTACFYCL